MASHTRPIKFRFPIAHRPDYYHAVADRYARHCEKLGGHLLALARPKEGRHLRVLIACMKRHEFWLAGRHLMQGSWCPECRELDQQGARVGELRQLQALAGKRGGKLLSREYENARTPLSWKCQHGHTWTATADNVRNKGSWCPECALQALFDARDKAHRKRRRSR